VLAGSDLPFDKPLKRMPLHRPVGNLFDSAIMKTSVISKDSRPLSVQPQGPPPFEAAPCSRTGGLSKRLDDPSLNIDENCMRSCAGRGRSAIPAPPKGEYACADRRSEAGHHRPALLADGRSPAIGFAFDLKRPPEAAAGGGLALIQTGDQVRIDLNKGTPIS